MFYKRIFLDNAKETMHFVSTILLNRFSICIVDRNQKMNEKQKTSKWRMKYSKNRGNNMSMVPRRCIHSN